MYNKYFVQDEGKDFVFKPWPMKIKWNNNDGHTQKSLHTGFISNYVVESTMNSCVITMRRKFLDFMNLNTSANFYSLTFVKTKASCGLNWSGAWKCQQKIFNEGFSLTSGVSIFMNEHQRNLDTKDSESQSVHYSGALALIINKELHLNGKIIKNIADSRRCKHAT